MSRRMTASALIEAARRSGLRVFFRNGEGIVVEGVDSASARRYVEILEARREEVAEALQAEPLER